MSKIVKRTWAVVLSLAVLAGLLVTVKPHFIPGDFRRLF